MEAGAGHLPTPPVLLRARKQDTRVRLRVSLLEKTCHTLATQVPPLEFPRHPRVHLQIPGSHPGPSSGEAFHCWWGLSWGSLPVPRSRTVPA